MAHGLGGWPVVREDGLSSRMACDRRRGVTEDGPAVEGEDGPRGMMSWWGGGRMARDARKWPEKEDGPKREMTRG